MIKRIVAGRRVYQRLTSEELFNLEAEYIKEAERVSEAVGLARVEEAQKQVLFERMLSPLQYWLENWFEVREQEMKDGEEK
jgi:hypothetical protein